MTRFARRTGLTTLVVPARRYLWTDAFAVCNFLGLERTTADRSWGDLALRLVDQVHHELGRHRADDPRTGWISGLSEEEGEKHPTRGGLRIGKPLPERLPSEPFDEELEWNRDGQYFHYLTRWMHALDQVARWTGRAAYGARARELSAVAHRKFTHGAPGSRRITWKANVDLSRPLVPSMGQHDPLDGFVTCREIDATAEELHLATTPDLTPALRDYAEMMHRQRFATVDPLGLGGVLSAACSLVQLGRDPKLVEILLAASVEGLSHYVGGPELHAPAEERLAFRELGLSIGLAGAQKMNETWRGRLGEQAARHLDAILPYAALGAEIEALWLDPASRRTESWMQHEDINEVMLATCLAPDGFLILAPKGATRASVVDDSRQHLRKKIAL